MSAPTVSVVIPTYNSPDYLAEALESVFAQTFTDYEVVVVDDGSTDDTPRRLEAFAGRVRVVTQDNGGIGVARNRGIDAARGRFVAPMDHDDLWEPTKLEAQVTFLREHPECVSCVVPFASTLSPNVPSFDVAAVAGDAGGGVIDAPLGKLRRHYFLLTSALMFDRDRTAARYATQRGAIEDVSFQLQLLGAGPVGVAGPRVLAYHRQHAGNFSRNASYYYHGMRQLRRLERGGAFAHVGDGRPAELDVYLAHLGRVSAARQLLGGQRLRGLRLYLGELPRQLRHGSAKFLLAFPLLSALPASLVRKAFREGE